MSVWTDSKAKSINYRSNRWPSHHAGSRFRLNTFVQAVFLGSIVSNRFLDRLQA